MKKVCLALLCVFIYLPHHVSAWGFYGHKMVNRLAVYSLPPEMFAFYKANIDYLTENAVNPDKRRYSDTSEACRHYIDLDHYEKTLPIDTVPIRWNDAVKKLTKDTLLAYGIVPWHIQIMLERLTTAFKEKDMDRILFLSADIGHYIADAHVPLHASENYNGQLTGQHGIHGFWESRLPEMFSAGYDLWVGKCYYISNPLQYAWQASISSFAAIDTVLSFEKKLSSSFDATKKYTIEFKGSSQVKTYSKEYATAYNEMLNGQVERRLKESILSVSNIWYTAWVNAGQPDLNELVKGNKTTKPNDEQLKENIANEQKLLNEQRMIGRDEK
ncbi:MAG: zinc dependent phospholipase C family protein [Bacteroidota bacterium]